MFKASVLYPNRDEATFDMDYYCNRHMALVRERLGDALKGIAVDQGVGSPGAPAPFVAAGHLLFDSLSDLQSALNAHAPELLADVPNYTNTSPVILVSEVKM